MPLEAMYSAPKALAQFSGWSASEPETGYCWFDAPLEIGGVVEAGLVLRGGCYKHLHEQHVTFELAVTKPGILRRIPLARIEWRSIRGGHRNKRRGDSPWRGRRVGPTHHHSFELNWLAGERRMRRGNLPLACDVEEEMPSFESLRTYVGKLFRISNIGIVPMPPWEYDLFNYGQ